MDLPPNFSDIDFWQQVRFGKVSGAGILTRHGYAPAVVGSLVPIAQAKLWQTPSAPVALQLASTSANDAIGGTGARQVQVEGIKSAWTGRTSETFNTNGLTQVPIGSWLRVDKAEVVQIGGSYPGFPSSPNAGRIDITAVSGGAVWATIDTYLSVGTGNAFIGCVSLPQNTLGVLLQYEAIAETAKTASMALQVREAADITSSLSPVVMKHLDTGVVGAYGDPTKSGYGPFVGPCDVAILGAITAGISGAISCSFELGYLSL